MSVNMELHLSCFMNSDRPQIRSVEVSALPKYSLDPPTLDKLKKSIQVSPSNMQACCVSARLWEDLLEAGHRIPFLLVRVADMRMALGSTVLALDLYDEAGPGASARTPVWRMDQPYQGYCTDQAYRLNLYKNSSHFSASQHWRTTTNVALPYCRLQRSQIVELSSLWRNLASTPDFLKRFLNLHCLETNFIEGTFEFDPSATTRLVELGFFNQQQPLLSSNIVAGTVRDRADAISILQDTHNTLRAIISLVELQPFELTRTKICALHKSLMYSSRVIYNPDRANTLTYLNIGVTRQASGTIVSAALENVKIQFCPSDGVDTELDSFCARLNTAMAQDNIDPFAMAAWISDVFLTIHPFEDGNGRLSRILASIPLLKKRLSPICVLASNKTIYMRTLNAVRGNRDGDYSDLMAMLYESTRLSIRFLGNSLNTQDMAEHV